MRTSLLINAAGAWADDVAHMCGVRALGIVPMLRTVAQVRVAAPVADDLPIVLDLSERFYFKAIGGGRLWLTPHDEQHCAPGDVAPDALDIAIAIDRLSQAVDWHVEAVERKWAGLRSFAPDRLPVYGHDAEAPGFFWFAGQGALASRPHRRRRGWGRRCCWGRTTRCLPPLIQRFTAPRVCAEF